MYCKMEFAVQPNNFSRSLLLSLQLAAYFLFIFLPFFLISDSRCCRILKTDRSFPNLLCHIVFGLNAARVLILLCDATFLYSMVAGTWLHRLIRHKTVLEEAPSCNHRCNSFFFQRTVIHSELKKTPKHYPVCVLFILLK